MMKTSELQKYNTTIELYDTEIFNNNHILFLSSHINKHTIDIKKINLLTSTSSHISYTYIHKKNKNLQESLKILHTQINLIQPNLIILLDDECQTLLNINIKDFTKIENNVYYAFNEDVNQKDKINEWFKKHALTNVTSFNIYYRDIDFIKQKYQNDTKSNYYFEHSDFKTNYKSFDGKYLNKVFVKNNSEKILNNTYEAHLKKSDIFYYDNIDNISHSKMIRCLFFDIETDFCNTPLNPIKPIISISFYDTLHNKFFCFALRKNMTQTYTKKSPHTIILFNDEKEMLTKFLSLLKDYDVLCGWYSNSFDVPYLLQRSEFIGIDLNTHFENLYIKKDLVKKTIRIFQHTIILYDALEFFKMNVYYTKPSSYSLNAVAQFLFGDKIQKNDVDLKTIWHQETLNNLIDYNIQDVYILKSICEYSNILYYPLQLQQICPQDFENVFYNSRTIENLLHHRYWKKNIYFPTKKTHVKPEYEGAIVIQPHPGIHKNVATFDFTAMYTHIYLTFNFSPDTLLGEEEYVHNNFNKVKEDVCFRFPELQQYFERDNQEEVLNQCIKIKNDFGVYYFLPKDWKVGILPSLEEEMLQYRKLYKKKRDEFDEGSVEYEIYDNLQGTAKTILNSIYGVVAYDKFILFNHIIPSSITSAARQLLTWTSEFAKTQNAVTLYGDTDSIFISFDSAINFEDFIKIAKDFESKINESFTTFLQQFTKNTHTIQSQNNEINFEKAYSKLFLTEKKKKYFGYLKFYKGKIVNIPKLSVVGFETRRDDTPPFFKTILYNVYENFLSNDFKSNIIKLYHQIKEDLRNVSIDDLIIKLKIGKDMSEYKNLPIHLRALKNANVELNRGSFVNMLYVKNIDVIHYDSTQTFKHSLDLDKYLEHFFIKKIELLDNDTYKQLCMIHQHSNNKKLGEFF